MIFNKNGEGLNEIRQFCQWVFGSNRFDNLVNDLILAEEEVKKVVGVDVFVRAERHYLSSNFTPMVDIYHSRMGNDGNYYADNGSGSGASSGSGSGSGDLVDVNDMLVSRVQRVVALIAYREFTINNDVSHGPTGRRVMIDNNNEKMAWEWMIEQDNDGLMRKANLAMDRLISFLDEMQIPEWINSDIYQKTKELLIPDTHAFDDAFNIDKSRRLFVTLIPILKEVQNKFIKPVIGTYYNDLITALKNNVWQGNPVFENILLYARLPMALFTISRAVNRFSIKIFPEGIVQQYKSYITGRVGSFPVKQSEKQQFMEALENDAVKELKYLENYITSLETHSGSGSAGEEDEPETIADRMDVKNKFVRV